MADKKITELTSITKVTSDILMVVEGPGTQNPANQKTVNTSLNFHQ